MSKKDWKRGGFPKSWKVEAARKMQKAGPMRSKRAYVRERPNYFEELLDD